MKTVRLRRLRVVILVTCLILVSSVGYWLMYVTSPRRTDLLSSVTSHPSNSRRHHEKSTSGSRLSDHRPGLRETDDGYAQNKRRNRYQQNEATAVHIDNKQLKEESHLARLAAKDDEYDYSDEEGDAVDHVGALPPVKNAADAGAARHDDTGRVDEREGNQLPATDDDDDDDDDDDYGFHGNVEDKNVPKKDDEEDSIDNKEEDPGDNHDEYESDNRQPPSQTIQRNEDIGDVRDDSVLYRVMKDDDAEPRRKQDGAAEEQVSRREGSELDEVNLDRVDTARRSKSAGEKLREQRDEIWRLQQANDGARASHLRSHNIAPVPRIYGSSALNRADSQELAATTMRVSQLDENVDNIDVESSRRAANVDSTSSSYFIVHSGRASRVNAALHPNLHTLPEHVQPDAYIFSSNRSLVYSNNNNNNNNSNQCSENLVFVI